MTAPRFGFRIVGPCTEPRRLIDWTAAFRGYSQCDERAETQREAYLSAFTFDGDFRRHFEATGSTRGFRGVCGAPWVWWDVDAPDDLHRATETARRLAVAVTDRYGIDDDDVLVFYSGSKGFHVGIPTELWQPEPSRTFNRTARRFAEHIAELAGVSIDGGVYDRVRAFRAPNSRHAKTGRYKRQLSVDELMHLSTTAILKLAEHPEPFDIPEPTHQSGQAAADWQAAVEHVEREDEAKRQRRADNGDTAKLNRLTLQFVRDGAGTGDRHRLLYSAARNLAEFGCPPALAHALLTGAGLDSGLPPSDVKRQIDCGLADTAKGGDE